MDSAILTKSELIKAIEELPEQIRVEDVIERLFILSKIKKGCQEADEGKTVSHEIAQKRMEKWLK